MVSLGDGFGLNAYTFSFCLCSIGQTNHLAKQKVKTSREAYTAHIGKGNEEKSVSQWHSLLNR